MYGYMEGAAMAHIMWLCVSQPRSHPTWPQSVHIWQLIAQVYNSSCVLSCVTVSYSTLKVSGGHLLEIICIKILECANVKLTPRNEQTYPTVQTVTDNTAKHKHTL